MTLTIRPLSGPEEVALFNAFPYTLNQEIEGDLTAGRRHPRWLWVALRGDRVTARAAWWSRPGDAQPALMDVFDVAEEPDGVRLLSTAEPALGTPPDYVRFVEPGWRERANPWLAPLEQTGARLFVERLRLEWRPGTPLRLPRGRLRFRPPHDADELIGLMTEVTEGSLDAHTRAELTRMTPREQAANQYREELVRYPSPPAWWRVGVLPDGEAAGFVIPAHNGYNPVIAYIGVRPSHRGRGHVDELLTEGTRILAEQDVPRIRAATDLANLPMAMAFARAGYVTYEHQLDWTWR